VATQVRLVQLPMQGEPFPVSHEAQGR
jgi:hypothetical protein